MSAGRSSQLVTCSSVERTKYLMSSKAIPDTSGPHVGRGFRSKSLSAFRRRSSIHSGSSFSEEMSRTTDRKSTRLNSSHVAISYAVFGLKKTKVDYKELAGEYHGGGIVNAHELPAATVAT